MWMAVLGELSSSFAVVQPLLTESHLAKLSPGLGNLTLNQASSGLTLFSAAQGTNYVATLKLL